jgi:hypothetical protein
MHSTLAILANQATAPEALAQLPSHLLAMTPQAETFPRGIRRRPPATMAADRERGRPVDALVTREASAWWSFAGGAYAKHGRR